MAAAILCIACVSGVYRIRNTVNGKFYIGSSVNIRWRAHQHLSQLRRGVHRNAHLQASFDLYGEQAFCFEMVEACDAEDLLSCEQRHIDAMSPHYNVCKIAGNTLGYRHTAESKAKMSVANKGNERGLGKRHTAETRRTLSVLASQRRLSPETRAKIAKAVLGNKSNTGRTLPPEHVSKVAAASLRMWNGDDKEQRRLAAAERARARWADPEWKAQQAAKIKAGKAERLAREGTHHGRQRKTAQLENGQGQ